MYFVRKKDLKIVGKTSPHIVQFQVEDYCGTNKIKVKKWEKIKNLEK